MLTLRISNVSHELIGHTSAFRLSGNTTQNSWLIVCIFIDYNKILHTQCQNYFHTLQKALCVIHDLVQIKCELKYFQFPS